MNFDRFFPVCKYELSKTGSTEKNKCDTNSFPKLGSGKMRYRQYFTHHALAPIQPPSGCTVGNKNCEAVTPGYTGGK